MQSDKSAEPRGHVTRATVAIDRTLWSRLRVLGFERGVPIGRLLDEIIEAWLGGGVVSTLVRTEGDAPTVRMHGSRTADPIREPSLAGIEDIKLMEVSLVEDTPENRDAGSQPITAIMVSRSDEVPGPKLPPGVVKGAEFHPVPKPSTAKKVRR